MDNSVRHIEPLTSLRFFAAIAVVLFHSGSTFAQGTTAIPSFVKNMLGHGWLGVPFFFILSGFILAHVYSGKSLTLSTSRDFFIARIARTYPVYLLSLLLLAPFVAGFDLPKDWQQFVMVQSWYAGGNASHWNGPAWSLSVEAFFYLVFPLLLPPLERSRLRVLGLLLAGTIGLLLAIWLNSGIPGIAGRNPFQMVLPLPLVRLPEFIYGLVLGIFFNRRVYRAGPLLLYTTIAAALMAMALPRSFFAHAIAIVAFGPMIYAAAWSDGADPLGRILRSRVLVFLGGASYAIYLLQVPARQLIEAAAPGGLGLQGKLLYTPLLVVASCLVFAFFEEPVRKAVRRLAGMRRALVFETDDVLRHSPH